jgi:three-Cys-motif partner protein
MPASGDLLFNQKVEIAVAYTQAYLEIMKSRRYRKLLYFDGFGGSGKIKEESPDGKVMPEGAAKRILAINEPCSFDRYYFVERRKWFVTKLQQIIDAEFPSKKLIASVVTGDCNEKLKDLEAFLREGGPDRKVLAFIDPCGMQLRWESIAGLKGLGIDMWILVPLGMGVSRLLKKDGNISDSWMKKLQDFLGMSADDIKKAFYAEQPVLPLFGKTSESVKKDKAIEIAGALYRKRLKSVFKYVSEPFVVINVKNNVMYHFLLVSNSRNAVKTADAIISKQRE